MREEQNWRKTQGREAGRAILLRLLRFLRARGRSRSAAVGIGLEIELDEEQEVGKDDRERDGVGPNSFPRRASRTGSFRKVHVGRNSAARNVQAELHNLELRHVLLPPQINLQDGAQIIIVLSVGSTVREVNLAFIR